MTNKPKLQRRTAGPEDTTHQALRAALSVPQRAHLWVPADAINFTPPLSNTVYGDGKAIFAFTTINDRPAFWIVRGDSSWQVEIEPWWLPDRGAPRNDNLDIRNFTDEIVSDLEEEFGSGQPGYYDEQDDDDLDGDPFPAIDLRDGYSWGRIRWPAQVTTDEHSQETPVHPHDTGP